MGALHIPCLLLCILTAFPTLPAEPPSPPVDYFEGVDLSIDDLVHPKGYSETVKAQARGLYRDVLPPGGLMKMAWATPVLRLNVSSFFPNVHAGKLNKQLTSIVNDVYDGFRARYGDKLCAGQRSDLCDISDAFTRWQTGGGYRRHLAEHREFRVIERMATLASQRFLKASGLGSYTDALRDGADLYQRRRDVGASEREVADRIRRTHPQIVGNASAIQDATMNVWATVHHGCHAHRTSDHPGTMISGRYYAKVPPGAGHIIMYDARRWASEDITIYPREGEMLIFPSWVSHQVMPTPGTDRRVAVGFNLPGEWEGTADVGTTYALPRMSTVPSFEKLYQKATKHRNRP